MEKIDNNTVIVSIGNDLRGDDNAGILLGALIEKTLSLNVINCGSSPENFTGKITKLNPKKIIIIDAMDFGAEPGKIKIVSSEKIAKDSAFTHGSLKFFIEYLKKVTGADIFILGIQPGSIITGGKISSEVFKNLKKISKNFEKIFDCCS